MDAYNVLKLLGQGSFGQVRLVQHKESGRLLACKRIRRGPNINRNVYREVCNQRQLSHPNIIGFDSIALDGNHLCILMEYANGGDLYSLLRRCRYFSEDAARYFFQQIVCGVQYLQHMNISHRDIKLENLMLHTFNSVTLVKIADFGYSKCPTKERSQCKSMAGSPAYIAPEMLVASSYCGNRADVWSMGILLYVMLVGCYPFQEPGDSTNYQQMLDRIVSSDYTLPPEVEVSPECEHLLSCMLVKDPRRRITVDQMLNHPWYRMRLAVEVSEGYANFDRFPQSTQSLRDIKRTLSAARSPVPTREVQSRPKSANGHIEGTRPPPDPLAGHAARCETL